MKELNEKIYKIIGSCMEVHRTLGPGLPVDFYRKALEIELPQKELECAKDQVVEFMYRDILVGELTIDFIVSDDVLLVLRSDEGLKDIEVQQILRCLQLTNKSIGLLVNLGQVKIQYKRILPSRSSQQPQNGQSRPELYRSSLTRGGGKTREGNPIS